MKSWTYEKAGVPHLKGDPVYKKPCHRYFFIKDHSEWRHTIDFRTKLNIENERMPDAPRLSFKTQPFLDENALNASFELWLQAKKTTFHENPQTSATTPSAEATKWIQKLERLRNNELSFLKIAEETIYYINWIETVEEKGGTVLRERQRYISEVTDIYIKHKEHPTNDQIRKDLEWIESMEKQGLSVTEIAHKLTQENAKRRNNQGVK